MKKFIIHNMLLSFLMALPMGMEAQTYNEDRVALSNYLQRQYENEQYEGARIVDDYEACYVVTAVALDPEKYESEQAMKRVSQVKGQRAISEFINGSTIATATVFKTEHCEQAGGGKGNDVVKAVTKTRQQSIGTVRNVELYASFKFKGNYVSIYALKMETGKKSKKK